MLWKRGGHPRAYRSAELAECVESLLKLSAELFESTGAQRCSAPSYLRILNSLVICMYVCMCVGPWAVRHVVSLELRREVVEALATLRYINEVGEQRAGTLLSVIRQSVEVLAVSQSLCAVNDRLLFDYVASASCSRRSRGVAGAATACIERGAGAGRHYG